MAGPGDDSGERGGDTHAARECMACRGSGNVISNLGGTPSTVTCPWCRGSGRRLADVDAQEAWAHRAPERQEPGEGAGEAGAPDASAPAGDAPGDSGDSAA